MYFDSHGTPLPHAGDSTNSPTPAINATTGEPTETKIEQVLLVIETDEAELYVGDLFRRKFGGNPPDFPKHFIALYSKDSSHWQAVGYVNFWQRESAFMCGGLVIEDRAYKAMSKSHRALIKTHGGIAEIVLGTSIKMLPDNDVVWGMVGDTQAERVDMRVGFVHTHIDQIIAYWNKPFDDAEKHHLTEEIVTVGPF
ncbi:MAG: hypothetical protein ACI9JM_001674 [Halioglobus sp.]|jgi:hypothetical protein